MKKNTGKRLVTTRRKTIPENSVRCTRTHPRGPSARESGQISLRRILLDQTDSLVQQRLVIEAHDTEHTTVRLHRDPDIPLRRTGDQTAYILFTAHIRLLIASIPNGMPVSSQHLSKGPLHVCQNIIVCRATQGFGGGILIPVATAAVGEIYDVRNKAKMQGIRGAVYGIESGIGPLIRGFVTEYAT